jgi:glutamate formiminotransferase/formiminotetrahydrofolate cyclodeaminase
MVETGNPSSVTDAAVGALCARSAVMGAFLNVKVNAADLEDKAAVQAYFARGKKLEAWALEEERAILALTQSKLDW